ncbi:MAG: hypothetical protein KGJ92_03560 [Actinomycetales bacterium]|nr:hypothetical protein [Actinomycetales bacterium]
MLYWLFLAPLVAGLVALVAPWRPVVAWLGAGSAAVVLALGIGFAARVERNGPIGTGVLRVDALAAFLVIVIGAVSLLATVRSVSYLTDELERGEVTARHAALYSTLVQGFIAAMLLAVVANNLGVLWVAIEATTVVTTFLVGHHRTPAALEASWKYIVICSVGIAVAFLGTVVLYLAGVHAHVANPLDFTTLAAHATLLSAPVVRLAFTLLVLGYGTKAGLVPLFAWLPDAHGQAPAPVSALMSGVLLSVALSAILRLRVIAVSALGPTFPRVLLLTIGIATLVVAASMLLAQRDLKRLLAYSTMEQMGVMTVAAGVGGPLALSGVLLHILGHGLVKGVLFLDAGEVLRLEGTTKIAQLRGLLARRPAVGAIFVLGLAGLLGLPPFSIFLSELTMLRAEAGAGLWWVAGLVLGVLAIILAAILAAARTMLLGPSETASSSPVSLVAPLGVALGAAVWFGLVAWPLAHLLSLAARIVA